jgi:hypothetical protein
LNIANRGGGVEEKEIRSRVLGYPIAVFCHGLLSTKWGYLADQCFFDHSSQDIALYSNGVEGNEEKQGWYNNKLREEVQEVDLEKNKGSQLSLKAKWKLNLVDALNGIITCRQRRMILTERRC